VVLFDENFTNADIHVAIYYYVLLTDNTNWRIIIIIIIVIIIKLIARHSKFVQCFNGAGKISSHT